MARKKKGGGDHGGHGWFVTFADLMALLMSFFVMIAAYSTQDQKKLQLVAGSMRDAFGVSKESRYSGIVEVGGLPVQDGHVRNARDVPPEMSTDRPSPRSDHHDPDGRDLPGRPGGTSLAAASLRQALQALPDIAELSKHIVFEDTPNGLNVSLVDHDGRSMFGAGSAKPYDRLRQILEAVAPTLRRGSQRVAITGHTAAPRAGQKPEGPAWDLSAARATAVRSILAENGVPDDRFASIAGKADTDPMFPDNPYIAANRRVTITLLKEEPPIPAGAKP
ncbi:OmpA/MotB family protein [Enterovirga rhinocerotis]|uniref:Chemotaxis protein MotB n=1 Tax=Enterovirga rhinocerotis TaxID=1339210 RepID=A0A4V6PZM8_9HYPH|nr:flagellar motor protein MotB [Enterovirga rhinocerotis]TDR93659.1 chemotaxis protein MotB [Enterovirga rhinocerotis]